MRISKKSKCVGSLSTERKMRKENLVTKLLERDPASFISSLVRKELSKSKGGGKGQEFDIDYDHIVALCSTEEYIDANLADRKALIEKFVDKPEVIFKIL